MEIPQQVFIPGQRKAKSGRMSQYCCWYSIPIETGTRRKVRKIINCIFIVGIEILDANPYNNTAKGE
jgi:hypothetical protein